MEALRPFIESLPVGVSVVSTDGRMLFANQVCQRITGYGVDEIAGMHVWDFMPPGPGRDALPGTFRQLVREQPVPKRFFGRSQHKDGHLYDVEVDWNYRRDAAGRVCGFLCVLLDVTEHRRLEERVRRAEKLESLGRLAGGIAHDLNNQLGGVIGFADMLHEEIVDEELLVFVNGILRGAESAAGLVRRLLAFARKQPVQQLPTDLHAVLREVTDMLAHSVDRRIRIELRLDAGEATVLGDMNQLQNAFMNLGLNARDAMPNGGRLLFETAVVRRAGGKRMLSICVADEGGGIPSDVMPYIFDPFYSTKNGDDAHTGLGLAAVHGTISQHGGTISVESQVGKGTVFTVLLPVAAASAETPPSAGETPPEADTTQSEVGRLVMVVDDEEVIRQVLEGMLRSFGYSVVTAADGEEAVAKLNTQSEPVALVILDLIMPKLSGRETFARLHALRPDLPVIVASGHSREDDAQALLAEGVCGFLQKPFTRQALGNAINRMLDAQA